MVNVAKGLYVIIEDCVCRILWHKEVEYGEKVSYLKGASTCCYFISFIVQKDITKILLSLANYTNPL